MPKILSPENIPAQLKNINQWCVWKGDKIPRHIKGYPLKSTEPESWLTFDECKNEYITGSWDGIGFCLTGSSVLGIDLDDCFSASGLKTWALKFVSMLPETYMEVSPSGRGLHIFLLGKKNFSECKKQVLNNAGQKIGDIEIYDKARYLTVTGDVYQGGDIVDGQAAIDIVCGKLWPKPVIEIVDEKKPEPTSEPAPAFEERYTVESNVVPDIVTLIKSSAQGGKFRVLTGGSFDSAIGAYGADHSRAVHALSAIVAWYTSDFGVLDSVLRSSALYSGKWAPDPESATRRGREGKWKALGRAAFDKLRAGYEATGDYYKGGYIQVRAGVDFKPIKTLGPSDETLDRSIGQGKGLSGDELYELHLQLAVERGEIRRDLFTSDLCYKDAKTDRWEPCFSRSYIGALRGECRRRGAPYKPNFCEDFLYKFEKDSDPKLLLDVPAWDQEDRIGYMCSKLSFEAVTKEVFEDLFKDWCGKLWGKILKPSHVQNRCILLSGKQGIGKDVWIKSLFCGLGRYLADFVSPNKFSQEQDMAVSMGSAAVMLISEFDKTENLGPGVLKDLITKTEFTSVRKYDRGSSSTPNRCSIIAACNPEHILKDATGNRRFLIFRLDGAPGQAIKWSYPVMDKEYSIQILAQCKALYESKYRACEVSEHVMQGIQLEHTPEDPHTAIVFDFESMLMERVKSDPYSSNGLYRMESLDSEFNQLAKNHGLPRRQILNVLKAGGCQKRTNKCRMYGTRASIKSGEDPEMIDAVGLDDWGPGVN